MRVQKIRTQLDKDASHHGELGGWLGDDTYETYLWFKVDGRFEGTLAGAKLYRLAKAIVRHMVVLGSEHYNRKGILANFKAARTLRAKAEGKAQ